MHRLSALLVIAAAASCGRTSDAPASRAPARPPAAPVAASPPAPPARSPCFETHERTSPTAAALFERRHLQGGGPTWLAVLEVLAARRAEIVGPWEQPPFPKDAIGYVVVVRYAGKQTWISTDDEAEGALFCAGDPALLHDVESDFERVNADEKLLSAALGEAKDLE